MQTISTTDCKHRRPIDSMSEDLPIINEDEEEGSSTNAGSATTPASPHITKDEKLVVCSRAVVMGVMLLTALLIAGMTYRIVSENEHSNFVAQFEASADQIEHMANKNALNIFLSIKTLSHLFPSTAHQADRGLPYVTVDEYEGFGEGTRKVSKASVITYSPVLRTEVDLQTWSAYSINRTFWISEGRVGTEAQAGTETETPTVAPFASVSLSANPSKSHVHHSHHTLVNHIPEHVYKIDSTGRHLPETGDGLRAPLWQTSPVPLDNNLVNFNLASNPIFSEVLERVLRSKRELVSKLVEAKSLFGQSIAINDDGSPSSLLMMPVFDGDTPGEVHPVLGVVSALLPWKDFFNDVLPKGHSGITVVADICGDNNTFTINGEETIFEGEGDLHDHTYDSMGVFFEFEFSSEGGYHGFYCHQHIYLYPTDDLQQSFKTGTPILYSAIIVFLFVFTALVFAAYDFFVSARQGHTALRADKSNAIVQELFPDHVAARLFQEGGETTEQESHIHTGLGFGRTPTSAIAELYPAATVLFADIAGFTAWSSMRAPHEVFQLLESIFQAFDALAKKRGVYKVETIGDCYVAVCGLPKPNVDHAVIMSRFAMSAIENFSQIVTRLSLILGPDTVDLGMRFGMHSGPVTAGVLRGDRARFQLFGDTVNTAARIESSGHRGRIHISEHTAVELIARGKEDWLLPRQDSVEAKGKGRLVTYWLKHALEPKIKKDKSVCNFSASGTDTEASDTASTAADAVNFDSKHDAANEESETQQSKWESAPAPVDRLQSLVDWNCELLLQLLNQVVARRRAMESSQPSPTREDLDPITQLLGIDSIVLDEVAEIIEMPEYVHVPPFSQAQLSSEVVDQLREYVALIASMYNDNPFHNFEHASHVTMSVNKLLTRIVAPQIERTDGKNNGAQLAEDLHDHTYGITSDPMTQFAVVLSALIHDLDHTGVSNAQLSRENPELGERYRDRSVAEQNSIDLAWSALLSPRFNQLRSAIFGTESELRRFRQLLVNSIIATDIFDKELGALRKNRWNKAFFAPVSELQSRQGYQQRDHVNRKATIVIEHLIQASDVAHTMQHWHVYQKWNQRLFDEMMLAYRTGRSDKDPSEGWFGGELWFFDNYVIPLAKKLKNCGVFGVCSDEYLNYALQNRGEWADKGEGIVQRFLDEFEARQGNHPSLAQSDKSIVGGDGDDCDTKSNGLNTAKNPSVGDMKSVASRQRSATNTDVPNEGRDSAVALRPPPPPSLLRKSLSRHLSFANRRPMAKSQSMMPLIGKDGTSPSSALSEAQRRPRPVVRAKSLESGLDGATIV